MRYYEQKTCTKNSRRDAWHAFVKNSEIMKDGVDRLPHQVVWAVVVICVLPVVFNFLGVDFGSYQSVKLDPLSLSEIPSGAIVDTLHHALAGGFVHTILEWSAFCTAIFIVILAFAHFRTEGNVVMPVVGVALFCSGCMDAFHTLAATRLIDAVADNRNLIPFTWAICRLFNALILIVGIGIFLVRPFEKSKKPGNFIIGISLAFGFIAYAIIHICAISNQLPQTMYPDSIVTRPYDVLPLVLYLFAGVFIFLPFHRKNPSIFSHALLISVIPQVATQLYMAFGSTHLFDNHFNIAHTLKIMAYMVPFAGLVLDYVYTYMQKDELIEKAQEASRLKSEFLNVMSHELRTPLAVMLGNLPLLTDPNDLPEHEEAAEIAHDIEEAGEHMLTLVNDLLDLSKIEAGKLALQIESLAVVEIVTSVATSLKALADAKNLTIETQLESVEVDADPIRLKQILINLLGNAIKFTDSGGITVATQRNNGVVRFQVRDTGCGLTEGQMPLIFDAFHQSDSSSTRSASGTGLGLSITKKLVEMHGGEISVTSKIKKGSAFIFTIPVSRS